MEHGTAKPFSVSVLIATRDRPDQFCRCLSALAGKGAARLIKEVIVLEDGSPPGVQESVRSSLESVCALMGVPHRLLLNTSPEGIAVARGRLSNAASPDSAYSLYLDDDVYLARGCLTELVECLASWPAAGVAGPRTVFSDKPGVTAHGANFVSRWTGIYAETDPPVRTECDWLLTTCFLVKREVLAAGVDFEPGFYFTHAEVDFCLRAAAAGFRTVYCPAAVALHDEKAGLVKPERLYYMYRNKFLVLRRGLRLPGRLTALLFTAVLGTPRYLAESLIRNRRADIRELRLIFKAVIHGLAGRMGPLQDNSAAARRR
ncbi:MAG: glycosyltransferase [Elusimicrobiales bacterium]|nr:glycosyltransferase [Elusimicrobiales bacterium]